MRVRSTKTQRRRQLADVTITRLRSSITNGSTLLADGVDHRSAHMRQLKDLVYSHTSDMANDVSESEQRLIRRAAMLTLQCELMESKWANEADGQATPSELEAYQRTSNSLRRMLQTLGLGRRSRNVTPNLHDYIAAETAASA